MQPKSFLKPSLISFIFILGLVQISVASIKTQSKVSSNTVFIADRLQFEISAEIEVPATTNLSNSYHFGSLRLPAGQGNLGALELVQYKPEIQAFYIDSISKKTMMKNVWKFDLISYNSGDYIIPQQIVEFHPANLQDIGSIIRDTLNQHSIQILARHPSAISMNNQSQHPDSLAEIDEMDLTGLPDIFEIEAPIEAPFDWITLGIYFSILIVALAIVAFISIWIYKKLSYKAPLTPIQFAEKSISELESKKLIEQEYFKEHFFELSEILKRYLSCRFNFDAIESTTQELLPQIKKQKHWEHELNTELKEFLESSDFIKFANHSPGYEQAIELNILALKIIKKSDQFFLQQERFEGDKNIKPEASKVKKTKKSNKKSKIKLDAQIQKPTKAREEK